MSQSTAKHSPRVSVRILEQLGVWEKYKANVAREYCGPDSVGLPKVLSWKLNFVIDTYDPPENPIYVGFSWKRTPEGTLFWGDVKDKYEALLKKYREEFRGQQANG